MVIGKNMQAQRDFDKFAFYFCLIDILFLPYAFFMAVSYSIVILLIWILKRFDVLIKKEEFKYYLIFSLLAMVSAVVGGIKYGVLKDDIVRAIQLIQIVGYYFLFQFYLEKHHVNMKKYLLLFLVFVCFFCLVYNFNKQVYSQIINFWNPRGLSSTASLYGDELDGYRFSFLWMDPNNIAYVSVSIVAFILTNEHTSLYQKIGICGILIFTLISAMSNGGFIALTVEAILMVLAMLISITKCEATVKKSTVLQFCSLPFLALLIRKLWIFYSSSEVAILSKLRREDNSAESRFEIWKYIFKNVDFLNYIFIGYGGVTIINGMPKKPHNGHFYLILSCGIIAYLIFMAIMFRKRKITPLKNYLWISGVFLGFTANVLIGEVKIGAIIFLLVACSSSKKYLLDRGQIRE